MRARAVGEVEAHPCTFVFLIATCVMFVHMYGVGTSPWCERPTCMLQLQADIELMDTFNLS